jgi:hypothetical protein
MNTLLRRHLTTLLAGALVAPVGLAVAAGPAAATDGDRPRITAHVTDSTPASGETFRVYGRLSRDGDAISGRTVKVQTLRDGEWENLSGAAMQTGSEGGYNLRVVLSQTGPRTLRVVGVVPGPKARKRFSVTVH